MISIPSSSSAACSSSAASVSARAAICVPWLTIVTRAPKRAKICANSSPTGPAPMMSSASGTRSSSSAEMWSIQSTASMPGIGGTAVWPPVAIRIRSAVSSRSSTRTVRSSTNAASPGTTVYCSLSTSTQLVWSRRIESFHARNRAMSTSAFETRMPRFAASALMSCTSSAAVRYAFVGRHAMFGHEPPQRSRSTIATVAPYSRFAFPAPSRAAEPAPRTMRSNRSLVTVQLSRETTMRYKSRRDG